MNTDAILKTSIRLSVALEGQAPIDSSAILWESSYDASITNTDGEVFSKRIKYSDLAEDGGDRVFTILYANGNFSEAQGVKNIAGEYFDIETPLKFLYIRTNVTASASSLFPISGTVLANSEQLQRGSIIASDSYAEADPMITLVWANSAITAIGSDNFYCDLILANS